MLPIALRSPAFLNNYAYGSFTSQGPVTALGSSLKVWMDPDAGYTDDGGGLISQWVSKDGSNLTVTAAAAARPTRSTSAISSPTGGAYSGLTFDASATCLVSTVLTNVPTGSTAGEIWAVVKGTKNTAASSSMIAAYGASSGVGTRRIHGFAVTALERFFVNDGATNLTDNQQLLFGMTIVGGNWSGTTEAGRINGLLVNPPSATIASLSTSTTRLRIGADSNISAANFFGGVIRHVLITTTLTLLQRLQLEAWLAWDIGWQRYLLPSNHPFRDRRP